MTTSVIERDPLLAVGVDGLLGEFHAVGVLGLADVHTARALGRIAGEPDEQVQLAVALTVRALRLGSVCITLSEQHTDVFDEHEEALEVSALPWPEPGAWLDRVRASVLVAAGAEAPEGRPLRLVDGLLYLERYWHQQDLIRRELQQRSATEPADLEPEALAAALDRLFTGDGLPAGEPDRQKLAAAVCAHRYVTVVAGGPGTGKTTTVAGVLAVLRDQQPGLRVALAAPTGKAAARLAEAIRDSAAEFAKRHPVDAQRLEGLEASTLHRLLGWIPGRTRFRHHAGNRLPYDVIVVDEMSMVPLTLMARLLEAVRPQARLVLVGDPDQLSPVEAGAVLADITTAAANDEPTEPNGSAARPAVVSLRHPWRFEGAIADLAAAIRDDDPDAAVAVLCSGDPLVEFIEADLETGPVDLDAVATQVRGAASMAVDAALKGDVGKALEGLARHRLLCAHRRGPYGVSRWSAEIERWVADLITPEADGRIAEWYPGRPLLVTANDYEQSLYNGDTGVVVSTPSGPRVAFARGRSSVSFAPVRLDAVQTVHAMTVHRAQGSQFRCVSFVVPPPDSPLLTRELLYTAVTRAQEKVQVIGTLEAVRRAIGRPARRASGLAAQLAIAADHQPAGR